MARKTLHSLSHAADRHFERARVSLGRAFQTTRKMSDNERSAYLNNLCYQIFAKFYSAHMLHHHQVLAGAISGSLSDIKGKTLLDPAGGTGSQYFVDRDPSGSQLTPLAVHLLEQDISIVFNDFSPAMLMQARRRFEGTGLNVTFTNSDIRDLARQLQRRFDTIFFSYAIHGIPEPKVDAMRVIYECLAPGGILIDAHEARARIVTHAPDTSGDELLVRLLLEQTETELDPEARKTIYIHELGLAALRSSTIPIDSTPHHELVTQVYKRPMS